MDNIITGFFLLLVTIAIVIFAYYMTIIVGKKTKKLMDGRYTQVLERTMIDFNTSITVLKVNKKIYIIAMQGKVIEVLDKIDESDWDFILLNKENSLDIQENMGNFFKSKLAKKK